MGMSEFYSGRDEQEAIATIHRALELGITLPKGIKPCPSLLGHALLGQLFIYSVVLTRQ